MEYIIKNGLNVCNKGFVIIETIEHYIESGYVVCNKSLNSKAWNITSKKMECAECQKYLNERKQIKVIQLKLF